MTNRQFAYILLLFLVPLMMHGQDSVLDSLINEIETRPNDTLKVRALNSVAFRLTRTTPDKALEYALNGIELSDSLGYKKGLALACDRVGSIYSQLGLHSKAIPYLERSINIYKEIEDPQGLGTAYTSIALVYWDLSWTDNAIQFLEKSEETFREAGLNEDVVLPRHNRAVILSDAKDTVQAMSIYQENLSIIEEYGLPLSYKAATLNNIGNIYIDSGDLEEGLKYMQEALEIKLETQNWHQASNSYNNLARAELKRNRLEQAEIYLDKAKEMMDLSPNINSYEEQLMYRADLEEKKGNFAAANGYLRTLTELRDSLHKAKHEEDLKELLGVFNQSEQEYEIQVLKANSELQEAENRQSQRLFWIVFVIAILLMLSTGILFWAFWSRRRSNLILEERNRTIEKQQESILRQNLKLQSQNEELEALNQEQDGLIQIVAHDLKAPFSKIRGLTDMVKMAGPLTPPQEKASDLIRQVSLDAGLLIQDLLDLSRADYEDTSVMPEPLAACEILHEVVNSYSAQSEKKNITVQFTCPKERKKIAARRDYLVRVLDNLVSNAIKFSPHGTTIQTGVNQTQKGVEVYVRDEGPGISEEDQKMMFRKFQRLSAQPTGGESSSGLGLSIVKALTEKMGGKVEVWSKLGDGTRFMLQFPYAEENS